MTGAVHCYHDGRSVDTNRLWGHMTPARVMVAKAVNRRLAPRLLELGFELEGNEDGKGWRDGRPFGRKQDGLRQAAFVGREKLGNALGLLLARERRNGSFDYLDVGQSLGREALQYGTQEELEAVIERIVQFLDGEGTSSLAGVP